MNSDRQIKLGALISYISTGLNMILGLIYTPWLLSAIGADNYYIYSLGTTLMAMLTIDMGISMAVTTFIAKYITEKNNQAINNFLGVVFKLYITIDILIFLILLFVFPNLSQIYVGLTPNQLSSFKIVFLILALFTLITFPMTPISGIMTAYENFIELKLCGLLQHLIQVGLIVVVLLFGTGYGWSSEFCLYMLVLINALCGGVFCLIKLIIVKKKDGIKVNWKYRDRTLLKSVLFFSVWVFVFQLSEKMFTVVTPSLFGMFSNTDEGAIYSLAVQLEGFVYGFACAINGMFVSKVTATLDRGGERAVLPLMTKVGKIQTAFIGLVFCGFFFVGEQFLGLWAGGGIQKFEIVTYTEAMQKLYISVLILFGLMLFTRTQCVAESTVYVKQKTKNYAIVCGVFSILFIVVAAFLAQPFGVLGVVCAYALTYLIRTICLNVFYYKTLKLDMPEFLKKCNLPGIVTISLTIASGYFIRFLFEKIGLNSVFRQNVFMYIAVYGLITCILFAVFTALVFITKSEREELTAIIKRKVGHTHA